MNRAVRYLGTRAAGRRLRSRWCETGGQSLIEFALALPVLLLILIGIADIGRTYYYTVMIAGAAREAAAYAATNPSANATSVSQHGCNATGLAAYGSACPSALTVTCISTCPTNGADATVRVTYSYNLLSAYLVDRVFAVNPIVLRADSHFPGSSQ